MDNLIAKGLDAEAKSRDERRNIMAGLTEVKMTDIISKAIQICGVQNAEVHALVPPHIDIHIESSHGEKVARDIIETLEDSTGVAYKFAVNLVEKIEVKGIRFRRHG